MTATGINKISYVICRTSSKGFEAVSNVWAHQYLNQHHSAHLHADLHLKTLQAHYTDIIGIFGYGAIGYPS
jgi:hypothetical protein